MKRTLPVKVYSPYEALSDELIKARYDTNNRHVVAILSYSTDKRDALILVEYDYDDEWPIYNLDQVTYDENDDYEVYFTCGF